jgi:hypothetical protein
MDSNANNTFSRLAYAPYTAADVQHAAARYNEAADLPEGFEVRHTSDRRRYGMSLAQRGNPQWFEIIPPIHTPRAMTELFIDRFQMQDVRFRAWSITIETMPPYVRFFNASRTVRVYLSDDLYFTKLFHPAFMGHALEFRTPVQRRADLIQFLAR